MAQLTISEVARELGLRPSAIRYYEKVGILSPTQRKGGQRRYDTSVLYRLAVIRRSQQIGFTLDEIRELFFGFDIGTRPGKRWQAMAQRKLSELEELSNQIRTMKNLLYRIQHCHCSALSECGQRILQQGRPEESAKFLPLKSRQKRFGR